MRQLVYTKFITNNYDSFHLWWRKDLVKHQKVWKYYEQDCRNFKWKSLKKQSGTSLFHLGILSFCSLYMLPLRKKCPYSELFWSAFSQIRTEYGEIRSISLYSVQMRKNADQNNSEYGHFSRRVQLLDFKRCGTCHQTMHMKCLKKCTHDRFW